MTYCFITLELWNNGNPIKKNKVIKGSLIEYSEWLTIQHNKNVVLSAIPITPQAYDNSPDKIKVSLG